MQLAAKSYQVFFGKNAEWGEPGFDFTDEVKRLPSVFWLLDGTDSTYEDLRIFYRQDENTVNVMDIYRMNRLAWPVDEDLKIRLQREFGQSFAFSNSFADIIYGWRYVLYNTKTKAFISDGADTNAPTLANLIAETDWIGGNDFQIGN
jgi:hypothetical protein